MTIRHQQQNVSAEIDLTTLFDIEIEPANALNNGEEITGVKLTRRDFHDEIDGVPEYIDLMDIFYTEQEIDERIKIYFDIYPSYNQLPAQGKSNHIYLVPYTSPTDPKEGIYKEYIWTTQNKYEALGSTEMDLRDMQLKSNISTFFPNSDSNLSDVKYPSERLVKISLNNKVDKVPGKQLSTNDFTNEYKNKLDGIEAGADKTIVDSAIDSTSTNPVQNKVIYTELNTKVDKVAGKQLSTNDFTNAYKNKVDNISTVGITNDYNDLDNLPTISTVGITNDYEDLDNLPNLPVNLSDLNNDLGFIDATEAAEGIGVVDVVQNGNANPVSSNGVYDNSAEIIQAMTDEMDDVTTYVIDDEQEHIQANLLEILEMLAIKIREAN